MLTSTAEIGLVVTLRVCPLDETAVRALRAALLGCEAGPEFHLVVDLREADDRHEITLFALLSETARTTEIAHGNMTALGASRRLSRLLVATGVPVVREEQPPHATARKESIVVGTCAA